MKLLNNTKAYEPYEQFVLTGQQTLWTNQLTRENWGAHCAGIFNILKDGIETEFVRNNKLDIVFDEKHAVRLSVPDYFLNLIMWRVLLFTDITIEPKHIFFPETITQKTIAAYLDKFYVIPNRKKFDNKTLNNIIDDTLHTFKYLDEFALYFANTCNISDDVLMAKAIPEYRKILNADLSGVPLEQVKDKGMELTNKMIDYIVHDSRRVLGFDHCLTNAFRSQESIRPRQYKEAVINIGTKPDGLGSVYPHATNNSFINGGVSKTIDHFMDASTGRLAQIWSKNNVGDSGSYARVLGLNSIDTFLNPDPHYACDTKNLIRYEIKSKELFDLVVDRYFRWQEEGTNNDDILITSDMYPQLAGKTIYLKSPITCASAARGEGVCFRCYGDIAYTNIDIAIGKFAAEIISSKLTQRLLSAKHLLETKINEIVWEDGFLDLFEMDGTAVRLLPDLNLKGCFMIIDPQDIYLENEDDDYSDDNMIRYNEYVKKFTIIGNGKDVLLNKELFSKSDDNLYITPALHLLIRGKAEAQEDKILVPLSSLSGYDIFYVKLQNNELSKTMNKLMDILDKNGVTLTMNKESILQTYNETLIDGGINVKSVHNEILIMNQIRDADNVLEKVDWTIPHARYQLLTLNKALMNHPAVTITLLYNKLSLVLFTPLTFKKNGVSFVDLFFMKSPQKFINSESTLVSDKQFKSDKEQNLRQIYIKTAPPEVDNSIL
jgi:hypothetical protein